MPRTLERLAGRPPSGRSARRSTSGQPPSVSLKPTGGRSRKPSTARWAPYGFVLPAFSFLAMFGLLPIVVAGVVSLSDLDIGGLADPTNIRFVGLDNYQRLLNDPYFWTSVRTTALFVVFGLPAIILLSLGVALGLARSSGRWFQALRGFYFVPAITAIVAISLIWGYLYNTQFGLVNHLLALVGLGPVPWLSEPTTARISVALVAIWRATGLNIVIFLAALQAIPQEYYEAAALDGANRWQRLIHVTLPLLRFALLFVTVTTMIGWLQFFDEAYVLTRGGPARATTSISLFIYDTGFSHNQFGYASAGSLVLFIIIAAVTLVQVRRLRNEDA